MVRRRRTARSAQTRFDAVIALLTGEKTAEVLSLELGVAQRSLYRWREQLLAEGPAIFEPDAESSAQAAEARIAELEQLVGRLTLEMAVLKKASGLLNARSQKDGR